jgi:hypothetical protein
LPSSPHFLSSAIPPVILTATYSKVQRFIGQSLLVEGNNFHHLL